jgi:AAA+ superfamily predicted ATPase
MAVIPSAEATARVGRGPLQRLDHLLGRALEAARAAYGAEATTDSFRGLYVSGEQAARSLDGVTGEPALGATGPPPQPDWGQIAAEHPGWRWLRDTYGLSEMELDLALIALAPDVDLRYERVYGYLQDDVSRRRPTVDLALNLLTTTAVGKLDARMLLGAGAPLVTHRVITVLADPMAVQPPLLAHILKLDEQIVDALLGQGGLDRRLVSCCRLLTSPAGAADEPVPTDIWEALVGTVDAAWGRRPSRLYFQGPKHADKQATAQALAGELGAPLLVSNLAQLPPADYTLDEILTLIFREAWLHGALLYLDDVDALQCDERARCREVLARQLARHPGVTILAGAQAWAPLGVEPLGVLAVPFAMPDVDRRRRIWEQALAAYGAALAPEELDALAERFRLAPGQIREAMLTAHNRAGWRLAADRHDPGPDPAPPAPTLAELFAASRGQTGHDLTALARKIEPIYGWDDIILPSDPLAQLREICQRVAQRQRVMGAWGFEGKLSHGKGVSALFSGPPGTGKTMAAEVIARELGLDLFKVDLAAVVSKYIGETEKNLERIFTAAADANAILFFDEADALFGKRSEVRDAHDRYANIEISYLLQRMELYEGLVILATNLRQHIDDAFTRRLQFVVEFPFPDEGDRRRIWQGCFPATAPRDPAIDLEQLARRFRLSGANISNIVLGAAFLAAADDTRIGMDHLLAATRREYQKMGKVIAEDDLHGDLEEPR